MSRACLGLAGTGREEDRALVRDWAKRIHVADTVKVVTDAALLLAAGTPEGWGLALVAGTGSIAWGRSADGRESRAGGWGYLLGDAGSGYAVAMSALRAVTRAADGVGPRTSLTEAMKERLRISDVRELVPMIHGGSLDRPALAALASVVVEQSADAVAQAILDEQARELARTALAAATNLGFTSFPLALAGGLLVSCDAYRERVLAAMRASASPEPVALVREPAGGALRLAAHS